MHITQRFPVRIMRGICERFEILLEVVKGALQGDLYGCLKYYMFV